MSRNLSISETGLRLIKAFEGYRPVDRELVSGARVVGYGHRVHDERPRAMDRGEAEETLRLDLAAYEEMINEEVHAPLSQSQFDALCSLAFNIGPKAFRDSDTVRALNNGRVLDAANGFDIWRKATINGDTYVVDALMRRRTAEKSLFLRTERGVPGGRALELSPDPDAAVPTDDGLPVFTEDMRAGVIAKAPYEAVANPMRRREDQGAGVLTLSEIIDPEEFAPDPDDLPDDERGIEEMQSLEDTVEPEPELPPRSKIGEAADALSERLDALIDTDTTSGRDDAATEPGEDWPQSLIQPIGDAGETTGDEADAPSNLVAFPGDVRGPALSVTSDTVEAQRFTATELRSLGANDATKEADVAPPATVVIDDLAADDVIRSSRPPGGTVFEAEPARAGSRSGLWIPGMLGFALLGASAAALAVGARDLLGEQGPWLALAGAITGALMIAYSLYLATAGRGDAD